MDARSVEHVRATLDLVRPQGCQHVVEVLSRLLSQHPEVHQKFPKLRDIAKEDLRCSDGVREQANLVYNALDRSVVLLTDEVQLKEHISAMGPVHKNHAVTADDFMKFQSVVLEYLTEKLGSSFGEEQHAAFSRFVDVLIATLSPHL